MITVVKEPGQDPVYWNIENELKALQEAVGGYIEVVPFVGEILCICNEEGKFLDLKRNFPLGCDSIFGNAVFVGDDGEEFRDLTDEEAEIVISYFEEGNK